MKSRHHLFALFLLAPLLAGCLELDTRININADGSATITERVLFSQRLLDLDAVKGNGPKLADLLSREAVLGRMKHMGEKTRLVSHTINEIGGARESVAVFQVDDANDFYYVSPFLAYADYAENSRIKLNLEPLYEGTWWGRNAGDVAVSLRYETGPKSEPPLREGEKEPPGPSPAELQMLRQLQPIFRDALEGFRLRMTVECYCPIRATGFGHRGKGAGSFRAELIDFSDKDLDNFGGEFLANEEVMLDLMRGRVGAKNVVEHVRGFANNVTLPVYIPSGSRLGTGNSGKNEIYFPPSQELFDRHFKGKMLTFYFDKGPDKTRPATYAEIGYQTKKTGNVKPPDLPAFQNK